MAGRKEHGAEFPMPIKAVPYHHQMEAFRFACGLFGILPGAGKESGSRDAPPRQPGAGCALLMEMGTGKTLTTIGITGALSNAGRIRRVLVVAPLSILGVWEDEFQKFADFPYCLVVLSGNGSRKRDTLRHMAGASLQVAVVNYESAWRMEKDLGAWRPDLIVVDEGHKIKTHNISASRALHRLGAKAGYRLLLTGTVITNKAVDVFSQYKFVDPAIFGQSFYAFRATKAECLDLPEMTDILRQVELEPPALQIYRGLVKESYAELSGGEVTATNILTRLLRLSQLTGGFIGNDETSAVEQVSCAKLSALEDILDGIMAEGKKLVIIARFVPEIKAICRLLENRKLRYSCIAGGVRDREAQVAAFQNEPEVMVFVGQIATAGLGITLTAASTMVFYSLDYSMSNFEQAKARIHRVGQRMPCTYLYLVARGTVDEKVLAALGDKADLARTLVDDYRSGRNPFA